MRRIEAVVMLGLLVVTVPSCAQPGEPHAPVKVLSCRITFQRFHDGTVDGTYHLAIENVSRRTVLAARIAFASWTSPHGVPSPFDIIRSPLYDYKRPLPPGNTADITLHTSTFHPKQKAVDENIDCAIVSVRFNDGGRWVVRPDIPSL
jgi:hypothetical protein